MQITDLKDLFDGSVSMVVMAIGLWWSAKRVEKVENKADEREKLRDDLLKITIETISKNTNVLSVVLERLDKEDK